MEDKILVTGSLGQVGSELTMALREKFGEENVIGIDIKEPDENVGCFEIVDATCKLALKRIIEKYKFNIIYHLVSILSVEGEKNPERTWTVNVGSLKNILDLAVDYKMKKLFFPSSIAVFGETTPKDNTPQRTILEPTTMYGVTKIVGENLCHYYFRKYGLDVRSLRYPGLISHKTVPGGGTTDYAVEIFHGAIKNKKYICFLKEDAVLPMMYMNDAIRGAIELMEAESSKVAVRTSYNYSAISFSPAELTKEIKMHIAEFKCEYKPDERQKIADSWPRTIDDSMARKDWGWQHEFSLKKMTSIMLEEIGKKLRD